MLGVKPNFVHLEQFRFTVHNSFETRTWPDPVHRLLTVVTSPRAPRRACPQVKRQQRIQCCSGLVGSHSSSDTPWCGVCRRRNITYLGSAWLVSIFASPGLHRHLRIIEVGKMHGTLSKAMRYKVSNCWLICEIKPRAKSTCHIINKHLPPKYASRLCQLGSWTFGKKYDLFIENNSDRKLDLDSRWSFVQRKKSEINGFKGKQPYGLSIFAPTLVLHVPK